MSESFNTALCLLVARLRARLPQSQLDGPHNMWIVKPGGHSKGVGVAVHNNLEDILSRRGQVRWLLERRWCTHARPSCASLTPSYSCVCC